MFSVHCLKRPKSLPLQTIAIVTLLLSGCATPALDRQIAELRAEIETEQRVLSPLADPYRAIAGKDAQLDMSGRPLLDSIEEFNKHGAGDWMTMSSYDYSGHIAYSWTDCPWPFPGRIGFKIVPAFDEAFQAAIRIDKIEAHWNKSDGLAFALKRTLGGAIFLIGGETEICRLKGTIPIGGALVIAGANSAAGSTTLIPIPNEGLEYRIKLDQPIYMIAYVATPVWGGTVPLWAKFDLSKGKIPNMMGREGEIQLIKNGVSRKYVMNVQFDSTAFLDQGLTVAGPVEVIWQP